MSIKEQNEKQIAETLEILDLELVTAGCFRGSNPVTTRTRAFGGQLVAQSFVAADRSADGLPVYSFQCNFISPGDLQQPIIYDVEPINETKRFKVRRVTARQQDRIVMTAIASFFSGEDGFHHQAAMPHVPAPDELPTEMELFNKPNHSWPKNLQRYLSSERPFDIRPVESERFFYAPGSPPRQSIWLRAVAHLPDDPAIHRAMIAYISDVTMIDTALVSHGKSAFHDDIQAVSLTHAVHFHQPARVDEWLLYAQDSPFAGRGLGFVRGQLFSRNGNLVASIFQDGLIRHLRQAR